MTPPPRELLDFLYRYDPRIQSLALALRKVVHEELAPCHEYIFTMRSKVVLVYSSTERAIADGIGYIGVNARHLTLGFHHGVDFRDPDKRLSGAGKAMRHVKVARLSDLDRPEIRGFLRQARTRAGIKRRRGVVAEVVTRVKPKTAPRSPNEIW
jgi:uncharacterized protein DUF1801